MKWLHIILYVSVLVLLGVGIACMMEKTFENMEKTSGYFKQIARDLTKIYEIRSEMYEYIKKTKS